MTFRVRLTDPGELIAAVPTLVGFHPAASLVVIGTIGRRVGPVLRVDLPEPDDVGEYAAIVADALPRDVAVDAATLVVINQVSRWDMTAAVSVALSERGVRAPAVLWATSTSPGAAWSSADGCHRGVLPDLTLTAMGAAAAVAGIVVLPDRDAVVATVRPVEPQVLARRAELLRQPSDEEVPLQAVLDAIDDAWAGRLVLDDARVVRLARALAQLDVRDRAIKCCIGERADAAAHLWLALTREMPAPQVAEAAALTAVSAFVRGDGVLAMAALDRADHAQPGHRLSSLLRAFGAAHLPPELLREVLEQAL